MNITATATLRNDRSLAFRVAGSVSTQPRKLLFLAHGVGANETNLAALAEQAGGDTLAVLPRGPLTFGVGQYAWSRWHSGRRGRVPISPPPSRAVCT